jgi:poly(hydroxyalkanoate) granule-associated protein
MVTKTHKSASDAGKQAGTPLGGTVKDSAQQIWLAGLGAFAKAQEEGSKVFDALVKEGMSIQRKTQSAAEEKISEATSRMAGMATDISSRASGQWNKMEGIFEERVSQALKRLGVPSAKDVAALLARVDDLERRIGPADARSASRPAAPRKAAASKKATPARKRSPARKSAS